MGTPGIIVVGNNSSDNVRGSAGDDTMTGVQHGEWFYTGLGDDRVFAGAGDDFVFADLGDDWLDGGSGTDTISFYYINVSDAGGMEASEFGVTLDLAKHKQDLGYYGIKTLFSFENAGGTALSDVISGDEKANRLTGEEGDDRLEGRDGNDTLVGGTGNDTLIGGTGADLIFGGAGSDRLYSGSGADILFGGFNNGANNLADDGARDDFIFTSTSNSPSSTTRDTIYGFFEGATGDKIDLSRIDANGSASGDGKFTFIGSNSIGSDSTSQVQVRATGAANVYVVRIDLDNDSSAEMQLLVLSTSALTSADFIL